MYFGALVPDLIMKIRLWTVFWIPAEVKMKKYPLLLSPVTKSAIWGGNLLSAAFGKKASGENIAESWELTVRKDANSIVSNGEASGMTLGEYLDAAGQDCIGSGYANKNFPLLIKFIDAAKPLSVQVHPDDADAARLERDVGKTEMWYIIDAKPGAGIVYGLCEGVTRADIAAAVAAGETERTLRFVPVKAGETYFIPAGLVHAIGEGILIAEIQQNSDLTYRLYDYGRLQADGKPRELHVEKALEVTKILSDADIQAVRFSGGSSDAGEAYFELLCNSEYFRVGKITLSQGESAEFFSGSDSFVHLLCVSGRGKIVCGGEEYEIKKGEGYFLPAGTGEYILSASEKTVILESKMNPDTKV